MANIVSKDIYQYNNLHKFRHFLLYEKKNYNKTLKHIQSDGFT